MRRAMIILLLLLLIPFSAAAAESVPAEVKFDLVLEPARDILPGDRICRSIVLENLTEKQLNLAIESVECRGDAALLKALTFTMQQKTAQNPETETTDSAEAAVLLSERTDRLQGQKLDIPLAVGMEAAGDALYSENTERLIFAASQGNAERRSRQTVQLEIQLDFDPEATAELMGAEARIILCISGTEATAGEQSDAGNEGRENGSGYGEGESDSGEQNGMAERKESAGEKSGSSMTVQRYDSTGGSSRGVLSGERIRFEGGPGMEEHFAVQQDIEAQSEVLEVPEDPSEVRSEEAAEQERVSGNPAAEKKAVENDARLASLQERFRSRLAALLNGKAADAEAADELSGAAFDRRLSVRVEETRTNGIRVQQAQSVYGGEAVTVYLGDAEMKSKVRNVLSAMGNLFLWLMIFCAVYAAISAYRERRTGKPAFFMGYKPVMILSESMEPTYPQGSIVLVRKQKRSAETGDVVMFSPGDEGGYVIHRIVGESEDGFITRGDHNNTEDRGTIEAEQIYGTVTGILW